MWHRALLQYAAAVKEDWDGSVKLLWLSFGKNRDGRPQEAHLNEIQTAIFNIKLQWCPNGNYFAYDVLFIYS